MSRHRTTDPACRKHRAPRTPLGRWWFDRNRGRSCGVCVKPAAAWQCPECRDEMDVKFQRSHRRICATLTQIERMRYCVCPNCTRCGCGIWERHHANLSEITRVPARSDSGLPVDGEERIADWEREVIERQFRSAQRSAEGAPKGDDHD